MSQCQKCKSERIITINAKCSDTCQTIIGENEQVGYVPGDMGIGGGDYVEFEFCADCGQIQGDFPLPQTELETSSEDEIEQE